MNKRKSLPPNIKAILFDLGNTLYDKQQYLDGAFRNVAHYLKEQLDLDLKSVLDLLYRIWKVHSSHYEFLFKDLLEILGIYSARSLDKTLHIYHSHKCRLKPYPGVTTLLANLKKHYKIGVVTDGHPQMQRNKIRALGWKKMFDIIIYTADFDKSYLKPNPFVYQLAMETIGAKGEETIYVGDNPHDDFKGARQVGIFTIRVLQGEFKNIRLDQAHEADVTIKNIRDLSGLLRNKR